MLLQVLAGGPALEEARAPAKNRQLSTVRSISNSIIEAGLPQFCISIFLIVSRSASMASATLWSRSLRARGVIAAHSSNAAAAASTAASTSSGPLAGTFASTSPVAGFSTSSVAPPRASTQLPPMKFWSAIARSSSPFVRIRSGPI